MLHAIMAKVKFTDANGRVIEISDISFAEAQTLVSGSPADTSRKKRKYNPRVTPMPDSGAGPNYAAFFQALSEKGKRLIEILKENKAGISAELLAEKMGFRSTNQIGGVTGGGMARLANRYKIDLSTVYTADIRFDGGQRQTTYRPGSALFLTHTKTA